MHKLVLENEKTQEPTSIYGNKYIKDESPKENFCSGEWYWYTKFQTSQDFSFWISQPINQIKKEPYVSIRINNEEPSTQLNLLDIEDKEVQEIIFQLRNSNFISINEILADRLITLFNEAKQEDPNIPGINIGSLYNFYDFLLSNNNIKRPSLSLTPDNTIYASWKKQDHQLFSVHFLPNCDTKFVIFKM